MLLAKSIIFKKIRTHFVYFVALTLFLLPASFSFSQDNSPYSRYGIGDLVPNTNVTNRSMGGVSAGYADVLSVNFNNPASYSSFKAFPEPNSKKISSGRVLLDVGINIDNRTLREPNQVKKFTASNATFSYLQLGVPLRQNWGMSFGLRQISRISYNINRMEQLFDGNTGRLIDSAYTEFKGDGGAFLPNIGTGFAIKNLSVGASVGYLFGKKQYSTTRRLISDTVSYLSSVHSSNTSFGDIYFNAGLQYKIKVTKNTSLRLGLSGNREQKVSATKDVYREAVGIVKDTVYSSLGQKGTIIYPSSYTTGFMIDNVKEKGNGWSIGADYTATQWDDYRFFDSSDNVQSNWQIRVGGQFRPEPKANYFSNVAYRAGFFTGPDYINVNNKLPQLGITFGMGLPLANYNRLSPGQFTIINLGFEYVKRGNNDNLLKENLFRLSVGLNFSDLWFNKRKYD